MYEPHYNCMRSNRTQPPPHVGRCTARKRKSKKHSLQQIAARVYHYLQYRVSYDRTQPSPHVARRIARLLVEIMSTNDRFILLLQHRAPPDRTNEGNHGRNERANGIMGRQCDRRAAARTELQRSVRVSP